MILGIDKFQARPDLSLMTILLVRKKKFLLSLLGVYAPEDVYNADESGLFNKLMLYNFFIFKNETCHGGKMSKERVVVLECTNFDGIIK